MRLADRDQTTLGLTGAAIAVTAWGATGVVIKAIDMESMSIAFYRFALYAAAVIVWLRSRGVWPKWHVLRHSLAGGVCLSLDVALFFTAVKLTTIVNATIISALQPVLVMAVAGPLFGERIRRRDVAVATIAVAGVVAVVVLSAGRPEWNGVGDILAVGALIAWTGYLVLSKRSASTLTSMEYTVGTALWTTAFSLAIGLAVGHDMGPPALDDWLPLAGLALGGGVIGHTLMNWSLVRIPLWIGSALTLLIPVTSSLLAWVFLEEPLSAGQLVAMAVVIGVLVVLVRGQAPSESRVDDTVTGDSVGRGASDVTHGDVTDGGVTSHDAAEPERPLLSVLDLAVVSDGTTSGDALTSTTALARRADELGYHRFWVAEHHNMPTVASTSPAVLIAHLAAATRSIRIGSGGVMLPNHAPLAIAEQFALLEALHPGRIDLGIGRAPGTDPATAAALRRSAHLEAVDDFPRDLIDLMGMLGDVRSENGMWRHFAATPRASSTPMIGLLGSSGYSAQLAGMLGLPFAFAHHFDTGGTLDAIDLYREHFRPSADWPRPHVIVTAAALAADTDAAALHLAGPGRLVRYGIRSGRFLPLLSPDDASTHPSRDDAWRMPSSQIVGSIDTVMAGLTDLVGATDADEIMLSTTTHGLDERAHSMELIATAWGLAPRS